MRLWRIWNCTICCLVWRIGLHSPIILGRYLDRSIFFQADPCQQVDWFRWAGLFPWNLWPSPVAGTNHFSSFSHWATKLLGCPALTCRQIKPSGWKILNLAILCFKHYCVHVLICVYLLVVCLNWVGWRCIVFGALKEQGIWEGAHHGKMCARVWWVSFQKMKFQALCTSAPQCILMYLHIAGIKLIFNVHLI